MKKILIPAIALLLIGFLYLNTSTMRDLNSEPVFNSVEEAEEKYKNDWMEGLMEFVDEDTPLDSLYIPEFLR